MLLMAIPVALSAGILWLSAQEGKDQPEGVRVGEMAEKVKGREKAVSIKETSLSRLEQRLNTLQATLLQEQERLNTKEQTLDLEKAKLESEHKRELDKVRELEKKAAEDKKAADEKSAAELEKMREEHARELLKIKEEYAKLRTVSAVDEQLVRTFEAMTPVTAATALQELAKTNFDVAVGLLAAMAPKRAARVLDQLVPLDAKMAGDVSEKLGMRKKEGAK
jgi:hypothetical protein